MTNSNTSAVAATTGSAGTFRVFSTLIGLSALFVLFQYFTSGEFVTDGIPNATREAWITVHGFGAYPVMVFALLAAVVAFTRLRGVRGFAIGSLLYFLATVVQWLLGHAISTLGMDWLTPVHVIVAAIVFGLAIWLSVRSVFLRRTAD